MRYALRERRWRASCGVGIRAPKTAMIASPMYLSTTPPSSHGHRHHFGEVAVPVEEPDKVRGALIDSLIVVKPRMSVKRMVNEERLAAELVPFLSGR